jgi:hypothetical protein
VIAALVAALAAAAAIAFAVHKYLSTKRLAVQTANLGLEHALMLKSRLIETFLRTEEPGNIHGIGVGSRGNGEGYIVQVFVEDATKRLLEDPPVNFLPEAFRNEPIEIIEMPRATALTEKEPCGKKFLTATNKRLIAGLSVGNADSGYSSGTIGYFCEPMFLKRVKTAFRNKDIYILSNAHVLAKLESDEIDVHTCVTYPGPGDIGAKLVAKVSNVSEIKFKESEKFPNKVDAALAVLNKTIGYSPQIAGQWKVNGQLDRSRLTHNMPCKKFGRTSEDTYGFIYSLHLAIWVTYSDVGMSAFFDEQILILPTGEKAFSQPGDSGSLVLNNEHQAIGLLFAGSDLGNGIDSNNIPNVPLDDVKRIEKYGVANCISDVTSTLNVRLVSK